MMTKSMIRLHLLSSDQSPDHQMRAWVHDSLSLLCRLSEVPQMTLQQVQRDREIDDARRSAKDHEQLMEL